MTPQEDAKDAEYWRRRWWHDRRRAYRHRWNMHRFDAHCVKCGQDAMGADDDCPCWKMRLPTRKDAMLKARASQEAPHTPQEDQPYE